MRLSRAGVSGAGGTAADHSGVGTWRSWLGSGYDRPIGRERSSPWARWRGACSGDRRVTRGAGPSPGDGLGGRSPAAGAAVGYGQRSLYWALGVGFVVGLAAYTGGYALKSSVTTEPLAFVGDLLYPLGWPSGPVSSWSCSSRCFPRQSDVVISSCSRPMRQTVARLEAKATDRRRGLRASPCPGGAPRSPARVFAKAARPVSYGVPHED